MRTRKLCTVCDHFEHNIYTICGPCESGCTSYYKEHDLPLSAISEEELKEIEVQFNGMLKPKTDV